MIALIVLLAMLGIVLIGAMVGIEPTDNLDTIVNKVFHRDNKKEKLND